MSTATPGNDGPGHAADRDAGRREPDPPVERERPRLLVVEAGEAVDDAEGEEEEQRVEQDEARDDEPGQVCRISAA